jgi:sugar/nucleoside kinase (ribokinase family)
VEVWAERVGRSGSIVVLVDEQGERTMARDRGSTGDLASVPDDFLAGAAALHLTLYSLEPGAVRQTVLDTAARAHRAHIPVSLDLSSVAVLDSLGRRQVLALLDQLSPTVVLANEDEARWAGTVGVALGELTTTVVKRGPDPSLVWVEGRCHRVPALRLDRPPADTTGAGDAFAAGFLVAMTSGAAAIDAVDAGHRVAAGWLEGR